VEGLGDGGDHGRLVPLWWALITHLFRAKGDVDPADFQRGSRGEQGKRAGGGSRGGAGGSQRWPDGNVGWPGWECLGEISDQQMGRAASSPVTVKSRRGLLQHRIPCSHHALERSNACSREQLGAAGNSREQQGNTTPAQGLES
jgi:hypothetical protein